MHQMRQAGRLMPVDGSGRVLLVGSVPLLHPEAQTARCSMAGPTDLSHLGGAGAFVAGPVGTHHHRGPGRLLRTGRTRPAQTGAAVRIVEHVGTSVRASRSPNLRWNG